MTTQKLSASESHRSLIGLASFNSIGRKTSSGLTKANGKRFFDNAVRNKNRLSIRPLIVSFFQGVFALYEEGQIDRQTYEDYLTWFTCQAATPGGRAVWAESSPFLVKGAAAAVNERLERGDLPDILKLQLFSLDD